MTAHPSVGPETNIDPKSLVTISTPTAPSAESIRALRTHLVARHVGEGHRALAICGASSGVGCTFVAANLAVSLSQIGVNTLLIDADLRSPTVDKIFGLSQAKKGLRQCLSSDDLDFGSYIASEIMLNLSVMFSGGQTPNAQELLASGRFVELMDFCLREFDATIIDTPPANSCSDADRICNVVSYALIVAKRNKSFVNDVKLLAEQLRADHAHVIGTVLNDG